jgi:hypothetical protein
MYHYNVPGNFFYKNNDEALIRTMNSIRFKPGGNINS